MSCGGQSMSFDPGTSAGPDRATASVVIILESRPRPKPWINRCSRFGEVAFAHRYAVKCIHLATCVIRFGLGAEIIFDVLPIVPALIIRSQCRARIVAAMHHAMLASRIPRHPIDYAIFVPFDLLEHFLVTAVMAISHQVTRRFPAFDIPSWDRPRGAGHLPFAGQKFLVHRRAKNRKPLAPLLDVLELLPRH